MCARDIPYVFFCFFNIVTLQADTIVVCPNKQRVARNTRENTKRCRTNYLYDYKITIFPMTPERYISLPFELGCFFGGLGGYPDCSSSLHARFFPLLWSTVTTLKMKMKTARRIASKRSLSVKTQAFHGFSSEVVTRAPFLPAWQGVVPHMVLRETMTGIG